MKIHHSILAITCSLIVGTIHAQKKTIAIADELKNNSQPLKVKRKGIRSMGRYQFGDYKIIDGKSGPTKTRERSKIFGAKSRSTSENKQHFTFVNGDLDSLFVQISNSEELTVTDENSFIFREVFKWNDYDVKKGQATTLAEIYVGKDTIPWSFAIVHPIAVNIDDELRTDNQTYYRGTVIKGDQFIEIEIVNRWQNGKKHFFMSRLGYELFMDSESIGAVQLWPLNRQTIWINDSIDPDLQFVVAASLTTLLVRRGASIDYDEL